MSQSHSEQASSVSPGADRGSASRGRSRGNRGGHGKAMRARGRKTRGRPAAFGERLLLEGEQAEELDDEDVEDLQAKYGKRGLASNAFRYGDPDETGSGDDDDPEAALEKERIAALEQEELAKVRERQQAKLESEAGESIQPNKAGPRSTKKLASGNPEPLEENDVDTDVADLLASSTLNSKDARDTGTRKNNVQILDWDDEMIRLKREKEEAESMRELRQRLQGSNSFQNARPSRTKQPVLEKKVDPTVATGEKSAEAFLDDLLG